MRPRTLPLVTLLLVATACGTRLDHDAVIDAARGPVQPVASNTSAANGATLGSDSLTDSTDAGVGDAPPEASPAGGRVASTPSASRRASAARTVDGTTAAGAAAKERITIASVGTVSGPVGAFVSGAFQAVSVWVKWANLRGGANGHPIRHIVGDDGNDPAKYAALVRRMVEQEGAIAFVFNTVGYNSQYTYVTQKRVPIVGHEGGLDSVYDQPMIFTPFPSGSTYAYGLLASLGTMAIPQHKVKLASLACADYSLCATFDRVWSGPAAKELGFSPVYRSRPSLTQPDFTAECLAARQAGAEALIVGMDHGSILRLSRSCARQGYHPLLGMADQLALPQFAADPAAEGAIVGTKLSAWPARDKPGLAELHDVFASMLPGVEVNGAHMGGWVSAKIFEAATKRLPDHPTSADVLDGLWSLRGETVGGLTYPVSFFKDQPSARQACWSVVIVHDRKYLAPNGGKLECK
jgi:branched-chain amino acid transport system substrate-binding protein